MARPTATTHWMGQGVLPTTGKHLERPLTVVTVIIASGARRDVFQRRSSLDDEATRTGKASRSASALVGYQCSSSVPPVRTA